MTHNVDDYVALAQWWQGLADTNNDAFLPLFADQHRHLVLMGGGGSGKSIFAGRKILERCTTEKGHRWLVCRKVAKTLRESCFMQLRNQCMDYYANAVAKVNISDMTITFTNGSVIIFAGLDDVEKLKSIYNITGVWIEEASEITEQDFNQLDIRLRGQTEYYKQIIVTFNPISIMHWLKRRFFDYPDDRVRTSQTTYRDNKFLDDEAKATLEMFRDTDPYYYAVYCLGQWGVTGRSVFDAQAITIRLSQDIQPVAVGGFDYSYDGLTISNIKWTDDTGGYINIYAPPEDGAPYVIGGDTAGDGSDSFVAQVIDNRTGAQVATLRHQFDEDVYAQLVYCLGRYYNTALIAIETNYSTYPVRELERLRYPKQYVRETVDDFTHKPRRAYGFDTNRKTRPIIISELIRAVRDDITIVNDAVTMQEMLTFVRNEDYRPEAEQGAHDDCIMSLAIAHHARGQQRYVSTPPEGERVAWTATMHEDYDNATTEQKQYLISKWGNPKEV